MTQTYSAFPVRTKKCVTVTRKCVNDALFSVTVASLFPESTKMDELCLKRILNTR
nr:MAG TPA: hypothetical protein [Caudoviricetes sp.]